MERARRLRSAGASGSRLHEIRIVIEQLVATAPGIGVPQGNIPGRDRTNTKQWARVSRHRGRHHSHSHSHCNREGLNFVPDAEGYVEAEAMEVGTVETEPLSASALALGFSVGLWRLLPTIQHPIMQRPATATPLLQPYPPLGTGVIPTSNITHMCPIAQLHGGR